jgi:tetratricopeptide (TPR) repeat protein
MKRLPIILVCIFIEFSGGQTLKAQTEALDSLNRALILSFNKDQKLIILNRLAYELKETDLMKSKELLEEALDLARKSENREELAFALSTRGFVLNRSDEFIMALNNYLEALKIYIELDNKNEKNYKPTIGFLYYQIGSLYKTLGSYQKAIEYCLSGLKIYEASNDKSGLALIYRVMGSIYKYKEDYEKSLFYYLSGLKINEEIKNLPGIANSYNNIGIVYLLMKDLGKALNYYNKSLEINLSINIENEAAINYGNIGAVYLQMNQIDSALFYFNKRYNSAQLLNDKKGIIISLESFGDFYYKKKEYSRALDYYKRALPLSRDLGILETTKNILKSMSTLYEENSDNTNGLIFYKSYINLRDSLLNRETVQKIEQMEMEYSLEKERNNHLFSEQKNKLYVMVGFASLLLFSLFLFLLFMNQKLKLKRNNLEQKQLEIDKQQLQNEVYFKDKELVSKAINLAEKNELMADITNQLKSIILDPKVTNSKVKDIIEDLRFHSDTHLWDEFEYTFLQVHPDYYNSLGTHFPELTPNERRLSAFLRLNLSTKEISNITHQSLHSLTVARTRLRKKLGIANTSENLATFLSKF